MTGRTLIAGIGNVFLGDDGFGVEVVNRLAQRSLPDGVAVVDIGIRGVHLAHQLLDGFGLVVLVDAMSRGDEPGTLTVLEVEVDEDSDHAVTESPLMDAHSLAPAAVLRLVSSLSEGRAPVGRVLVVGCEPEVVDVGMGLSPRVSAAIDPAVSIVIDLLSAQSPESTESPEGGNDDLSTDQGSRHRSRRRHGDPVAAGRREVSAPARDVAVGGASRGGALR